METLEKPLSPKVKVVKEEDCEITFSIEIPKDEVARETEAVYQNIQSRASLPGFRTGKVPMDLIRRNFADRAKQSVAENLIGRAAAQVIRERKLQTIDTPQVEKLEFEFDKPLSFHMKVEKDPDIKAKDYKGIKVNRSAVIVDEAAISRTLEELRERNSSLIASPDAKIQKNHFAVIDFEGKIDGKPFPGGSAKNFLLDMGTPQTIEGFSEGLVGAGVNEQRTVTVNFAADYPRKEWAGKKAVFEVSVKEIKEKKLPALDDEFAKDLGLASLAELRQKVKENLEKEETAKADKDMEDQLYQALLDAHTFSVPPTLVEERARALTQRGLSNLSRQGLLQPGDQQAENTLKERFKPQAEKDVRLSYLIKAIASQEKLEATPEDIDTLRKKAAEENKDNIAAVEKYFKEHEGSVRASLTEGKVLDFLKNNAKIKTAKEK